MVDKLNEDFNASVQTALERRNREGFQTPNIPTPEEPKRYNAWVLGLEEVATQLDIPLNLVEKHITIAALLGGYRFPEDILAVDRKLLYIEQESLRSSILEDAPLNIKNLTPLSDP